MTETYEDCVALRLLVEEQKAHMDEAANIGLNLLQRNIQLEQRLNTVEDQLSSSKDTVRLDMVLYIVFYFPHVLDQSIETPITLER